ncbi:hypothetical protein IAT38_005412 [Cryptococcus sp. DSM 104549]
MSFGGFGQSTAPKPAFGFGTPSAPSAFGQGQPQQQQQQGQGQAAGGGLFGAKPAGTSVFGQQPAAGTGVFGQQQQQQPPGGLFGSQQQQPQQGQQAGTSVFGQQQQQPQQQAGGGLFGAQQQQQPQAGGGLFGSTNTQQQQQPQAGGGLFGSTNNQQQQGQQPAGGLFGSTNTQQQPQGQQPQAGTSLFGAKPAGTGVFGSTAAAPAAGTGGLFGLTQAQQPVGGSSLFGAQPQQQQQQQSQTGGLFGQSQARPAGQSVFGSFGASTAQPQQRQPQQGGLFGSVSQANQQPQQQQQGQLTQFGGASTSNNALMASQVNPFGPKKELDLETRMRMVENAWNTNHPDCRFKYFFYNVVEEGTASRYGRPAGATDDAKWAKALRDNPDPNSLVPVLATGWADVKKRQQQQENLASVHQERIKEILAALAHTRQTSLASSIRLTNLQARQAQLVHRLIHLTAQTPQHIPLIQSTVFKQDEAEMLKQLEGVKAELEGNGRNAVRRAGGVGGGDGRGRLLGQVNELWGQLEEIRRRRKVRGNEGKEAWVTDEKMLGEIAEVLASQQNALQKLSDLTQSELFDADVMRQALGLAANER